MRAPGDERGFHPGRAGGPAAIAAVTALRVLVGVGRSRSCLPRRGAAQAPWRYVRGVCGHHRLTLADILPFGLTMLRGCVQVQVEAGANWKGDGDDGALAFLPLSSPPPAPSGQSIAESYQFPSETEDSPDNQSGDSSLETDDKNLEELKPPPF